MTCIKTGCLIYLQQYGEWAYGDAHKCDDILVIRTVWRGRKFPQEYGPNRHFTIHSILEWFDGDQHLRTNDLTGTLVVNQWTNHGMDGIPEPLRLEESTRAATNG